MKFFDYAWPTVFFSLLIWLSGIFINWWWLSFFSLIPLLYVLEKSRQAIEVALIGLIGGALMSGLNLIWFFDAWPINWIEKEMQGLALAVIFAVWLFISIIAGILMSIWAYGYHRLRSGPLSDVLLASAGWVLMEFVRAILFSLIFVGPVTMIGPDWTIGSIGYALADSPIMGYLAPLGGLYLLSFITVALGAAIYKAIVTKHFIPIMLITTAILAMSLISYLIYDQPGKQEIRNINMAIMNTYYWPSSFLIGKNEDIRKATIEDIGKVRMLMNEKLLSFQPQIIIWPEDSRFLVRLIQNFPNQAEEFLSNYLPNGVLMIDSVRQRRPNGQIIATMLYFSQTSKTIQQTEKQLLVPFGEYLPLGAKAISQLFNWEKSINQYYTARETAAGGNFLPIKTTNDIKLKALFCGEIFSPHLYRQAVNNGAMIIGNVASQTTFKGSALLHRAVKQAAQTRAAENKRYLVQASNMSPSFAINDRGKIIAESKWRQPESLMITATPKTQITFYAQYGNYMVVIAFNILIFCLFRRLVQVKVADIRR